MTTFPFPENVLCFHSGMSSKSDLLGGIAAGVAIGVVADKLSTAALVSSLPRYLDHEGCLFVDSGSFTSYASGKTPNWPTIMRRYRTLAELTDHPERLFVVAPDVIGDQAATLTLLGTWASELRALISLDCQVIVPLQAGDLCSQSMLEAVRGLLRSDHFTAGIPSNRAALSIEDCERIRHPRFHVLGRVKMDAIQTARIQALRLQNPEAFISADANWLRSHLPIIQTTTAAVAHARKSLRTGRVASLDHPRVAAIAHCLSNASRP